METKKISREQLKARMDAGENILLVDVMLPEYYAEQHIAGAKNAPVYEVAFLEHMEKLTTDKNQHIVVYNESERSLDVENAAEKLIEAGYSNVEAFPGGLTLWKEAGFPIEKEQLADAGEIEDGEYEIDVEKSVIGWAGRNAKTTHHGKVSAKSGVFKFEKGRLIGGKVVMDMPTIMDEDLTDDIWRGVLESHLKSSDFFDVKKYPEASFEFGEVEVFDGASGMASNWKLKGQLTIKDVTRPIEFIAAIMSSEDGVVSGQTHFDFDRTLWNVRYGSEKFFEKLGMHLVYDTVSLELSLVAKKK